MAVRTEVSVRLPNSPGALAAAFEALANTRIAVEAWHLGSDAAFRVVCDNPLLAAEILGTQAPATLRDVMITVVATRDAARFLRRCAAQGVNIDYAYPGSASDATSVVLVLGVPDAARSSLLLGI